MKSTLFASTLAVALTATTFGNVNVTELASCHFFENDWSTSISSRVVFEDLNDNGIGYIAFRVTTTSESEVDYTFDAWNGDFGGVQVYGLDDELCNGLTVDGPSPWKEEIESSSDGSGTFLLPAGDYFVIIGEARSGTVDITPLSGGNVNITELASCHFFENDWSTSISSRVVFEDLNDNGIGYIAFRVTTTSESEVDYTFDAWNGDFGGVQVYGLDDELCNGLTVDGPSPWKEEIESSSDGSGTFLLPAGDYFVIIGEARSGTIGITPCLDSDGDGVSDCVDNCPDDPNKSEPGNCGCGVPETDVFGDLDCDGDYDIDDARLAMTTFGIEEAEEDTCPADVDGDGSIGFSDVLIILNDWGACP